MKKTPSTKSILASNPVKVLLHMVQVGDDWAGKAADFDLREEHRFRNLDELVAWLKRRRNRNQGEKQNE